MRVAAAYRRLENGIHKSGGDFAKGKDKFVSSDKKVAQIVASELNADMCDDTCLKHGKDHANRCIKAEKDITILGVDSSGNPVTYAKVKDRHKNAHEKCKKKKNEPGKGRLARCQHDESTDESTRGISCHLLRSR